MKSGCGGSGGGRSGRLLNWKGGGGQIPSSSSAVRTGASRRCVRVPPPRPRATPTSQQQQQQHLSVTPVHMSEFAVLGLSPLASRNDVKNAYKRLALKYHPDVAAYSTDAAAARAQDREKAFREIKSAYESLMRKFEQDMETATTAATGFGSYGDEWEEWDDWMGFEGGVPVVYDHHHS